MCAHSYARKVTCEWCDPGRHPSLIDVHRFWGRPAALRGAVASPVEAWPCEPIPALPVIFSSTPTSSSCPKDFDAFRTYFQIMGRTSGTRQASWAGKCVNAVGITCRRVWRTLEVLSV